MPISQKLRLAYVAEWLLVVSVSAVPVEHSPVVEGDSSMVMIYEKREENPDSMEQVVNDAVRLDHEIAHHSRKGNRDSDSDGDSDKSEDGSVSLISPVLCFKLNSWFISSFFFWLNFCFMEE